MLVEELMIPAKNIAIIDQMATIKDALKLMKQRHVKSLIVDRVDENDAYGLITFKNILQAVVAADGDIDLLRVYDAYTKPVITISSKLDIKYASKMMINQGIKRLVVIDNNELCGILTMTDILHRLMASLEIDQ